MNIFEVAQVSADQVEIRMFPSAQIQTSLPVEFEVMATINFRRIPTEDIAKIASAACYHAVDEWSRRPQ